MKIQASGQYTSSV